MPSFSPKTIVQSEKKALLGFSTLVLNNFFYYNSDVMDNICDFNLTSEILGGNNGFGTNPYPYMPQRLWVVSKKAMRILLKEFGYPKRDFIPVMLANDKNEVER